jgi:hypothetical protein
LRICEAGRIIVAMSLRSACRALLILNLAYCALAVITPQLPGWKMFEDAEYVQDYGLADRRGTQLDVLAYLPRGAYLTDEVQLRRVVRFVCQHEARRGPFEFRVRPTAPTFRLAGPGCAFVASL